MTPKQRSHLKSVAHHLKPLHHVGKEGITEAGLAAVEEAFNQRELIKIKVQEASPQSARAAGGIYADRIPGVEHVQTIGRTVVLYRRHPDKPEIELPAG
ncbi:MAG: YhbY family RNA-binding protein [Gemmatimonadota bacterium]